MANIVHPFYKHLTRLLTLIITLNIVGMPSDSEARTVPLTSNPPTSTLSIAIITTTTVATAAAITIQRWYRERRAERPATINPANDINLNQTSILTDFPPPYSLASESIQPIVQESLPPYSLASESIQPIVQESLPPYSLASPPTQPIAQESPPPYSNSESHTQHSGLITSEQPTDLPSIPEQEIFRHNDKSHDSSGGPEDDPHQGKTNIGKQIGVVALLATPLLGNITLPNQNNNSGNEANIQNIVEEAREDKPSQDNNRTQHSSDSNNVVQGQPEGGGDNPPVSSQKDTSNDQPNVTTIGGNDQPSDKSDEIDSTLGSISSGGNGGGGDKPVIANINSVKSSPNSAKHFLNEILDYHGYTASMVHRSLENRLNLQAIAAGDDSQRVKKGLWAKGIVGNAIEQKSSTSAGYKANFHGFTVGADAEFHDDLLLGVAFSNILSRIKFKEQYAGDKITSDTKTASLYGMKNITNKVYVSATASLTQSDTKASYLQTNKQGEQFLAYQEKKNVQGGFIDARVHYMSTLMNGMILTPFLGMNYSKNALPGFSENDSDGLPFAVASLKNERTNLMVGTSLSLRSYSAGKLKILPKINASVNQQIHAKISSIKLTNCNGNLVEVKNNDKNKTTLGLGGSVGVSYKNTDVLVSYDAQVRNNFVGQQVSLKVRVNL